MSFSIDLVPLFAYNAIFVDQERFTAHTHIPFAQEVFLFPDAVKLAHAGIAIGEQGEGQAILVLPLALRYFADSGNVSFSVFARRQAEPTLLTLEKSNQA